MKVCGACRRSLPDSMFSRHSRSADGLQFWCKDCMRRAGRESRARQAERDARRARSEEARILRAVADDAATVHMPGVGDVEIELPPITADSVVLGKSELVVESHEIKSKA